jgi:hypothetical protein
MNRMTRGNLQELRTACLKSAFDYNGFPSTETLRGADRAF